MKTELALLAELHQDAQRQGPGSEEATRLALSLTRLSPDAPLRVADIGCGTGASTLVLAQALPRASILALDFLPSFLQRLGERAQALGVARRIRRCLADMHCPPITPASLDLIWSEGAIYNMGFASGVRTWLSLLRPGGILAVSEITWLHECRPAALERHWDAAYGEMGTAADKLRTLEAAGYEPLGYFPLPASCWTENYYDPLEARFSEFLAAHPSPEARHIVEEERAEISLFRQYGASVSYGFYIAAKPATSSRPDFSPHRRHNT